MTLKLNSYSILGLLILGCASETSGVVVPMDGLWEGRNPTFESDCDDSGGESPSEASFLDTALLFTYSEYTELSMGAEGVINLAPETLMDKVVCDLVDSDFDCPARTDRIDADGFTMIWTRTFAGTFYSRPDDSEPSGSSGHATEGDFVFSSDISCENGDCGENVGLACSVEARFPVAFVGEYPDAAFETL
jgi:hypothetical protein